MSMHRRDLASALMAWAALAVLPVMSAQAQEIDREAAMAERSYGNPDAEVQVIEFMSLTCPHCARFHAELLPRLEEDYIDPGHISFEIRDFPLDRSALQAALVARCAPQSRYKGIVDMLFERQSEWARADNPVAALKNIVRVAGMSGEEVDACLADRTLAEELVAQVQADQEQYDIQGTPAIVVNGETKGSPSSYDELQGWIEDAM